MRESKDRLTSKLAEQGEAHSNGTYLGWKDLRHVKIHGGVAAGAIPGLANCRLTRTETWLGHTPGMQDTGTS